MIVQAQISRRAHYAIWTHWRVIPLLNFTPADGSKPRDPSRCWLDEDCELWWFCQPKESRAIKSRLEKQWSHGEICPDLIIGTSCGNRETRFASCHFCGFVTTFWMQASTVSESLQATSSHSRISPCHPAIIKFERWAHRRVYYWHIDIDIDNKHNDTELNSSDARSTGSKLLEHGRQSFVQKWRPHADSNGERRDFISREVASAAFSGLWLTWRANAKWDKK